MIPPEFGPEGNVDVTSKRWRSLIMPALQEILDVNAYYDAVGTDERREAYRARKVLANEKLVRKVWGDRLTPFTFFKDELPLLDQNGFEVDQMEIDDTYPAAFPGVRLDHHFVTGKVPALTSPRIDNSVLLAYGDLLHSGRTSNPPEFRTPEHMRALDGLTEGMDPETGSMEQVQKYLAKVGQLSARDQVYIYGKLREDERALYEAFGDLAPIAKFTDRLLFHELRDSTTDVVANNFVGFGDDVLVNTYGGRISDAILAVDTPRLFDCSHLDLHNVYVLSKGKQPILIDEPVGDPEAAGRVVAFARRNPGSPLADFARQAA